jgi:hypothetical protein
MDFNMEQPQGLNEQKDDDPVEIAIDPVAAAKKAIAESRMRQAYLDYERIQRKIEADAAKRVED